jgi:hypothetical protein
LNEFDNLFQKDRLAMNYVAFEFQARSLRDLLTQEDRKDAEVSRKTEAWKHSSVDSRKNRKNKETPNRAINLI